MKNINKFAIVFASVILACNVFAGSISKGRNNRGVELKYEGFDIGGNGVVRFSLECVKNWGGQVGGLARVSAYYIDNDGNVQEKYDSVSCHVRGGIDGARKRSDSEAKSITVPVTLDKAVIKAYINYQETDNISDFLNKINDVLNEAVENATGGVVKKPLSLGESLEQAVAPAGGDKLTF